MKRCAFLTLETVGDFVIDDELVFAPLAALGWQVESVPWRQPPEAWRAFDVVVIRTPWDYQDDPEAFLTVLREIEEAGVPLFNRPGLVRWNLDKTYLRDLEARGVPIVPTLWRDRLDRGDLARLRAELGSDSFVVKPTISANADGAFRLDGASLPERAAEVESFFANRPLLAQPFVRSVVHEGEFSLLYFGGELSHCILKTPKTDDFRVQEEHGGTITAVEPGSALRSAGAAALAAIGEPTLQARVDLVRRPGNRGFWLMELELIEPSLYFRMDPGAPAAFARAFERCVSGEDGRNAP